MEIALLPTLDAHAHILPGNLPQDAAVLGPVLAMSLSLEEARLVVGRKNAAITWGAGCHPRFPNAQKNFDPAQFRDLVRQTAVVGEIGLDGGSRVPMETQLRNFRKILEIIADLPRIVSIHSCLATRQVLHELRATPVRVPILHWWTGSADETSQAVELGCYFSVHSQVARQSKFRTRVPPQRILLESDHGYNDPPAAIPCRVQWVEYLMAQQLKIDVQDMRLLAYTNLAGIVGETGTAGLLPDPLLALLNSTGSGDVLPLVQGTIPGVP